jgi:NDP-sugar pyrophosphorylase family protein
MEEDHPVSMLMYGLRKDIYDYMEKDFRKFLESGPDLNTCEYYLPTILDHMMKDGLEIKVLPTTALWKGVTYKEDLEELKEHIRKAIENGEYPENLWG